MWSPAKRVVCRLSDPRSCLEGRLNHPRPDPEPRLDGGASRSAVVGSRVGTAVEGLGVEFGILGPLEVSADGRRLPIRGGKTRALLGLLLVHANENVSAERLIDELWEQDLR